MPTYDYQCRTCGHRFEVFQSISAEQLTTCPPEECIQTDERKGNGEVTRIVSGGAGLVFKGEGFYLTDYVRKGKGEGGSKDSGGGGSKDSGGGGSKDSGGGGSGGSSGGGGTSGGTSGGGAPSGGPPAGA